MYNIWTWSETYKDAEAEAETSFKIVCRDPSANLLNVSRFATSQG